MLLHLRPCAAIIKLLDADINDVFGRRPPSPGDNVAIDFDRNLKFRLTAAEHPAHLRKRGSSAKGQVLLIYIPDKIHYELSSLNRIVVLNAKTSLMRNFISQQCISEKTPDPVFPPDDVHESVVETVTRRSSPETGFRVPSTRGLS